MIMGEAMLRIMITGAGGMLGTDLVHALEHEHEVIALDKRPAPHLARHLEICDLLQERKLRDTFASHKPDLLIHCAALTDVDYCEEHHEEAAAQNTEAVKCVTDLCNELNIPLVFFSTDYVFDGAKDGEYLETDRTAPVSFYGKTKRDAEAYITANAKRAVIFRISWLFGVYGRSFPKAILRQAAESGKLAVVRDQIGRPTYTRDVAEAIRDILARKKDAVFSEGVRLYHLTNTGETSWSDFARFILKQSGRNDVTVEDITSDRLKRPAPRPANSLLSLEKIFRELGVRLRSWEDAIPNFLIELEEARKAAEARAQAKAEADEAAG
ncbi:MAG: dTDP-4-dehydrorhamnose reductase [Candidatus Omnitrophica bacterium ADurb.Bin314]|nr:MAG: dTDP-4-dehydrorhamnose reductase [Candidatus Omnitrophica bacterium ADurb.Bin314]